MTAEDTKAVLEAASRAAYAAHCLLGGAEVDPWDQLRDGDLRLLESALRAPRLPTHIHHTIRTALDAYTQATLAYSQSGGRSAVRPPWEQEGF